MIVGATANGDIACHKLLLAANDPAFHCNVVLKKYPQITQMDNSYQLPRLPLVQQRLAFYFILITKDTSQMSKTCHAR